MKKSLLEIYKGRHQEFKSIVNKYPEEDLAGPFLMSPNDRYAKQKKPLLIIGQETFGWNYYVDDLKKQMDAYEEFDIGKNYYSSPFWNVTRKIEKAIGNEPYSCAWTNISKYDLNGTRAYGEYEETISKVDDVIIDEIKIIQPKICIFFTGPSFDYRLKNIFQGVEYIPMENWSIRQLAQLKHTDLPKLSFRTYHPNYLRRKGFENKFIEFITNSSVH